MIVFKHRTLTVTVVKDTQLFQPRGKLHIDVVVVVVLNILAIVVLKMTNIQSLKYFGIG